MLTNFLFVIVGSIRGWYRRRAERQAMWMATDGLSHLSDDFLSDIGIARDEITCAFLALSTRKQSSRRWRLSWLRPPEKPLGVMGSDNSHRPGDPQALAMAEFRMIPPSPGMALRNARPARSEQAVVIGVNGWLNWNNNTRPARPASR